MKSTLRAADLMALLRARLIAESWDTNRRYLAWRSPSLAETQAVPDAGGQQSPFWQLEGA